MSDNELISFLKEQPKEEIEKRLPFLAKAVEALK